MIVSTKKSTASNVRPGHKSKKRKFSVNQSSNKTEESLASTSPEKIKDTDDNIEISSSIRTMENKGLSSPVVAASGDTATTATAIPKKTTPGKTKKPRVNPTRPNTAEMVNAAIKGLADRGGSSLQAIKKYMVGKYKIDAEKQAIFIKKYLKAAVTSGVLIQTKGKGAAGSFKLASPKSGSTKPKKPKRASPKAKSPKKVVTTTIKKPAAAKPQKPKTTKANPAAKSPVKKAKPAAVKKDKPVTAKPKKAAPKKAVTAKK